MLLKRKQSTHLLERTTVQINSIFFLLSAFYKNKKIIENPSFDQINSFCLKQYSFNAKSSNADEKKLSFSKV